MIINPITNAAQAIGEVQGSITVTLQPEADGAHLRLPVADTGSGMDDATVARVFAKSLPAGLYFRPARVMCVTIGRMSDWHRKRMSVSANACPATTFVITLEISMAKLRAGSFPG